ncbi:hypothetical protein DICA1_A01948 [Diutina catenulata]
MVPEEYRESYRLKTLAASGGSAGTRVFDSISVPELPSKLVAIALAANPVKAQDEPPSALTVAVSDSATVKVGNLTAGNWTATEIDGGVRQLEFASEATKIHVLTKDNALKTYEVANGTLQNPHNVASAVFAMAVSPKGTLAYLGEDGQLWVVKTGQSPSAVANDVACFTFGASGLFHISKSDPLSVIRTLKGEKIGQVAQDDSPLDSRVATAILPLGSDFIVALNDAEAELGSPDLTHHYVCTTNPGASGDIDVCQAFGEGERVPSYYTASLEHYVAGRSFTYVSSTFALEVATVEGKGAAQVTKLEPEDDTSRAELPSTEDFDDTACLGVFIDPTQTTREVYDPWPGKDSVTGVPVLYVLLDDGRLYGWSVLDKEAIEGGHADLQREIRALEAKRGASVGSAEQQTRVEAKEPAQSAFGSQETKPTGFGAFGEKPKDSPFGAFGEKPKENPFGKSDNPFGSSSANAFKGVQSGTVDRASSPFGAPLGKFGAKPDESKSAFGAKPDEGKSAFGAKPDEGKSAFGPKPDEGKGAFGAFGNSASSTESKATTEPAGNSGSQGFGSVGFGNKDNKSGFGGAGFGGAGFGNTGFGAKPTTTNTSSPFAAQLGGSKFDPNAPPSAFGASSFGAKPQESGKTQESSAKSGFGAYSGASGFAAMGQGKASPFGGLSNNEGSPFGSMGEKKEGSSFGGSFNKEDSPFGSKPVPFGQKPAESTESPFAKFAQNKTSSEPSPFASFGKSEKPDTETKKKSVSFGSTEEMGAPKENAIGGETEQKKENPFGAFGKTESSKDTPKFGQPFGASGKTEEQKESPFGAFGKAEEKKGGAFSGFGKTETNKDTPAFGKPLGAGKTETNKDTPAFGKPFGAGKTETNKDTPAFGKPFGAGKTETNKGSLFGGSAKGFGKAEGSLSKESADDLYEKKPGFSFGQKPTEQKEGTFEAKPGYVFGQKPQEATESTPKTSSSEDTKKDDEKKNTTTPFGQSSFNNQAPLFGSKPESKPDFPKEATPGSDNKESPFAGFGKKLGQGFGQKPTLDSPFGQKPAETNPRSDSDDSSDATASEFSDSAPSDPVKLTLSEPESPSVSDSEPVEPPRDQVMNQLNRDRMSHKPLQRVDSDPASDDGYSSRQFEREQTPIDPVQAAKDAFAARVPPEQPSLHCFSGFSQHVTTRIVKGTDDEKAKLVIGNHAIDIISETEGNIRVLKDNHAAVEKYVSFYADECPEVDPSNPGAWPLTASAKVADRVREIRGPVAEFAERLRTAEVETTQVLSQLETAEVGRSQLDHLMRTLKQLVDSHNDEAQKDRPLDFASQALRDKLRGKYDKVSRLQSEATEKLVTIKAQLSENNQEVVQGLSDMVYGLRNQIRERTKAVDALGEQIRAIELKENTLPGGNNTPIKARWKAAKSLKSA